MSDALFLIVGVRRKDGVLRAVCELKDARMGKVGCRLVLQKGNTTHTGGRIPLWHIEVRVLRHGFGGFAHDCGLHWCDSRELSNNGLCTSSRFCSSSASAIYQQTCARFGQRGFWSLRAFISFSLADILWNRCPMR